MPRISSSRLIEFGETRRGWLGVRVQPVTDDVAASLGMDSAKGALISGVAKGGPVENGPIQAGDVVLKFDGKDIHEMRDLCGSWRKALSARTLMW